MHTLSFDHAGCGMTVWHAANATMITNTLTVGNEEHGISVGTDTSDTEGVPGDHFLVANTLSIEHALLGGRERTGVGPHNQSLNTLVYGNGSAAFGDEHDDWPSAAGSHTITTNAQCVHFQLDGRGDDHLQPGSPAIDAGTSEGAPPPMVLGIRVRRAKAMLVGRRTIRALSARSPQAARKSTGSSWRRTSRSSRSLPLPPRIRYARGTIAERRGRNR